MWSGVECYCLQAASQFALFSLELTEDPFELAEFGLEALRVFESFTFYCFVAEAGFLRVPGVGKSAVEVGPWAEMFVRKFRGGSVSRLVH